MNDKKISIITVCYNEEKEIGKTCESVVSQTFKDYEWIVVDGKSSDGTLGILNAFEDYISILKSEGDDGVYDAMNKGIEIANGEYVLFLNGGDSFFSEDVLEKVFSNDSFKEDVLYGDCCLINSNGSKKILNFSKKIKKSYFINGNINHQSAFIRKKVFGKYGNYDKKYRILADFEKWLNLISKGVAFRKIPVVVSNYKAFDGLSSQEKTRELVKQEKEEIIKKYFKPYEIFFYRYAEKLHFIIFSPKKFIRKYLRIVLDSRFRQPARRLFGKIK